ncbi:alpha/beta hydrolase [Streptomyces lavenduligriseus]|uniref:Alpha/beta hydrolase n=1 Tax=Streptomyces lavenduligriseus TaxID=67315 RepID=A0ABT0NTH5_9ACTN|nr:alpha/beta hydrolase [Streptomyces lavenduligriseus]MCL3994772.1 alpha/beta hydrolase [Streptomyces lavenduligriseus]
MSTTTPTVVLVRGAFVDAASRSGVIEELQRHDIPVIAPPDPLRGLASDAAYVASVAAQIDDPVVLVGHSYGGALITVAGTTENVVGLVHVAAYVLEEGESLGELQGRFPLFPLVRTSEGAGRGQRPLAAAFEETASAAWKTKPSWALVAGVDSAINHWETCSGRHPSYDASCGVRGDP